MKVIDCPGCGEEMFASDDGKNEVTRSDGTKHCDECSFRPRSEVEHLTYPVYCHICPRNEHGPPWLKSTPRNQARSIGSPQFGWLWHCLKHQDQDCGCPRGEGTEELVEGDGS
jgi:hypothetical protein